MQVETSSSTQDPCKQKSSQGAHVKIEPPGQQIPDIQVSTAKAEATQTQSILSNAL